MFARAAERLGVAREESLFVGDHPRVDIEGARCAGLTPVWFVRTQVWLSDLLPPPHVIKTLPALTELLDARGISQPLFAQ